MHEVSKGQIRQLNVVKRYAGMLQRKRRQNKMPTDNCMQACNGVFLLPHRSTATRHFFTHTKIKLGAAQEQFMLELQDIQRSNGQRTKINHS
jgi:hypothetical protein